MGNCCGVEEGASGGTPSIRQRTFEGQGHRLGTADEAKTYGSAAAVGTQKMEERNLPEPAMDPNLNDEERAKIRADRAAAAEARLKKLGGGGKKKKSTANTSHQPLKGPNSENLMRWNA